MMSRDSVMKRSVSTKAGGITSHVKNLTPESQNNQP
jgi:hypothetical protein